VRDTEIVFFARTLGLLLALLGSSVACKSEESAAEPESKRERARDAEISLGSAAATAESESPTLAVDDDPQQADKLADLDELCKALDRDYVDGTLSDYYRGIEPRSEWGKALRDAGNQSMQPGRLLEKAVAELAPDAAHPGLEHCRKLLDYLDDVE
jgi:hypothetical protein